MAEPTDAARLEALRDALRDAMRSRVSIEAISPEALETEADGGFSTVDWYLQRAAFTIRALTTEVQLVREDNARLVARRDQAEEQQAIWMERYNALVRENDRLTGKSLGLIDRLGSIPFRQSDDIPEGAVYVNASWWASFNRVPSVEEIEAEVAALNLTPMPTQEVPRD